MLLNGTGGQDDSCVFPSETDPKYRSFAAQWSSDTCRIVARQPETLTSEPVKKEEPQPDIRNERAPETSETKQVDETPAPAKFTLRLSELKQGDQVRYNGVSGLVFLGSLLYHGSRCYVLGGKGVPGIAARNHARLIDDFQKTYVMPPYCEGGYKIDLNGFQHTYTSYDTWCDLEKPAPAELDEVPPAKEEAKEPE